MCTRITHVRKQIGNDMCTHARTSGNILYIPVHTARTTEHPSLAQSTEHTSHTSHDITHGVSAERSQLQRNAHLGQPV